MRLKTIIQSLFSLLPFIINAQTYSFINYGVQEGLSQSHVSSIIQDKSGFIWLATESGVSKFDGKTFTNYTTENGLADNNVKALLLDKKGMIWMGHENGGLTKYDGTTFTAIKSEALPDNNPIYALYEDQTGSIWLSTKTQGAIVLINPDKNLNDKANYKTYANKEGLDKTIYFSYDDNEDNMWFLLNIGGIKTLNKKTNTTTFFNPDGFPIGQPSCLQKVDATTFLIGTLTGNVSLYNTSTKQIQTLITTADVIPCTKSINNLVYALYKDRKGTVWAAIDGQGLCRYTANKQLTFFNTSNGLLTNNIRYIFEDREGNIVLGTLDGGIEVFKGDAFVSFSKKDGLINNQVSSICQDNSGNYWYGTDEGISIYNPKELAGNSFKTISLLPVVGKNTIKAITKDKTGTLWIGTSGGGVVKCLAQQSTCISAAEVNETLSTDYVNCLLVDSKNTLWVGTQDGIVTLNLNTHSSKTIRTVDGLSDNDVTCLFEDSKGAIWVGTKKKGITVITGNLFKQYTAKDGLKHNSITSITEDKTHGIWIGTEGGGAFVYTNNTFTNYKIPNGLTSDFITSLTVAQTGDVWLGTNKGLNKYDATKKQFFTYSKNNGFTGVEAKPNAVYTDDKGAIWFGTVNGVFKYTPTADIKNELEPLTQLTRLRVNLKDYPITSDITLSHTENALLFDYIGISLSNPDGVSYQVMLEGFDKDWKPKTTLLYADYPNLSPGTYTFKLKACNSNGIYNKEPVTIRVTITPPWYKRWWWYLFLLVSTPSGVFFYIKQRERKLLAEKKLLEEKVNERTAEVVEKNKELDEKNKDITASIRYAKRIQDAILPPDDFVTTTLPKTFILFKPKDIVSGDFYWVATKKDKVLFAAVDCTGHGVPGAFMSIVGHNLLDQIVGEHGLVEPAAILDALNKSVSDTLRQSYVEDNSIRDGMDIALCSFDRTTNVLEYAGAYNPLWLIRNGELIETKANKFPIGNLKAGEDKRFTNHSIPLQKGDTIYIFSDGYADQFGGPSGKKFKYTTFKQLLLDIQPLPMNDQETIILKTIEEWRGSLEQVDDILIIGTRL